MDLLIEWLPIILALAVTGAIAGVLAGLLGVGGGIVIVPVLYLIFQALGIPADTAMLVATGTSLSTIIPTSISSIKAHQKRGNVDWNTLKLWVPTMMLGVIAGAYVATRVEGEVLTGVFGVIALLVALNMLFRASAPPLKSELPGHFLQRVMASIIGFFSVMMGIGGGTLGVPTLTAFNTATHRAVGTAAAFGLVIAIPGALMMMFAASAPEQAPVGTIGLVNIPGFFLIVPLTVLLAPVGVSLGAKIDSTGLKRVFALFLILVGTRMIFQTASSFTLS